MKKKKPQIGEIWSAQFANDYKEYYVILESNSFVAFTTMQVGTGEIQTMRFIDWQNRIWQKEV